jgi:hypothetical protein
MDNNSVQHINVKVFAKDSGAASLNDAVKVFHRWIKDSVCPEMLIDVAEYRHVPAGPGVLLIGLEANYSFDERENRLGLLYNRKTAIDGTFQSRLSQAHQAALAACDRLEKEMPVQFDRQSLEVFVNDRLLAPNTEATWQSLKPELEKYFSGAKLERRGEPRDLFRVSVKTASASR